MKLTKEFKKEILYLLLCAAILAVLCITGTESVWEKAGFAALYILAGGTVFIGAVREIKEKDIFSEELLMCVAAAGAFAIGSYAEGAAVFLFYRLGEALAEMAQDNSRKSIEELMNICPDTATAVRDGKEISVSPKELLKGETVIVKPGEKIPADGIVSYGKTNIDASSLTGESMPVYVSEGDTVTGGCVCLDGMIKITVTAAYEDSTVANIIRLVENESSRKAKADRFIGKFVKIYTPAVIGLAVIYAVSLPLLADADWHACIENALTFLVISCPCALVVSVPLSFFCGCAVAARKGILIKGGSAMETLSETKTVILDKTGTLTTGKPKVSGILSNGMSRHKLLRYAALAEYISNHPIAAAIKEEYGKPLDTDSIEAATELSGYGIRVRAEGEHILVGNAALMHEEGITDRLPDTEGTSVYVAVNGKYAGAIILKDTFKEGMGTMASELRKAGIERILISSGDNHAAASEAASVTGADGFRGNLLPADKCSMLEEEMRTNTTAFVGDGINDAPALVRADVGIAMGALGSDAAVEAADVVLMGDDPRKIPEAVELSRRTLGTAKENIVFTLTVKFGILALSAMGYAPMWAAVAADVGVTVIAVLNSVLSSGIFKKRKQ